MTERLLSRAFRRRGVSEECLSDERLAGIVAGKMGTAERGHLEACDDCFDLYLALHDSLAVARGWSAELALSRSGIVVETSVPERRHVAAFRPERAQLRPLLAAEERMEYGAKPHRIVVEIGSHRVKMEFVEHRGKLLARFTPSSPTRLLIREAAGPVLAAEDLRGGQPLTVEVFTERSVEVFAMPC